MHYIDLSRLITADMPVYPGDRKVEITPLSEIAKNGNAHQLLSCTMHTGTHIDSPSHMIAGAKKLTDFPLSAFVGKAKLIDARGKLSIDEATIVQAGLEKHDKILIVTGHDQKFYLPDYYTSYPILTEAAARLLVSLEVTLIGFDTPSPDYFPFAIHHILMKHDILIIENLTNLQALIGLSSFTLIALPLKINTDGALSRVIAIASSI